MRGLGKLQKNQKLLTNYRIIGALYVEPYSFEQLKYETRIHRNTLKLRLNNLVNDNIILREEYTFRHKNRFRNHCFYMLNWAKQDTKETVLYIVENKILNTVSPSYHYLNSLEIDWYTEKFPLDRYRRSISSSDFVMKIREFRIQENIIWSQILDIHNDGNLSNKAIEKRNELLLRRNMLFELIIYESMYFCLGRFLRYSENLSTCNMLIFFKLASLYRRSRPYTKFWDVMERMGY